MDFTIASGPEKYDPVVLYVDWWCGLGEEKGGIDHEWVGVKNTLAKSGISFPLHRRGGKTCVDFEQIDGATRRKKKIKRFLARWFQHTHKIESHSVGFQTLWGQVYLGSLLKVLISGPWESEILNQKIRETRIAVGGRERPAEI